MGGTRVRIRKIRRLVLCFAASAMLLGAGCSSGVSFPDGPSRTPSPRPTPPLVTIPPQNLPSPEAEAPASFQAPTAEEMALIELFIDGFAKADVPFHMSADGVVHGLAGSGSADAGLSIDGDVVGQDFDGHVALAGMGKVRMRVVDGVGYGHLASGEWTVVPSYQQTQPLSPFVTVNASDVEYVGETKKGRPLHVLRVRKWVGGDVETVEMPDAEVVSSLFDIHITDGGIPVKATLDYTVLGRVAARETRLDYHIVYRFSDVGEAVTIEVPSL